MLYARLADVRYIITSTESVPSSPIHICTLIVLQAVVDRDVLAAEGAAGGQGLRDVGGNVMNAIREMLQNIEFAPPERDDENEQDPPPQNWD